MKQTNVWLVRGPLVLLMLAGLVAAAHVPEPDGAGVRTGILPDSWSTGGPKCMESAEFQVHEYNPDFYILRQSGCSHYESRFSTCCSARSGRCSLTQARVRLRSAGSLWRSYRSGATAMDVRRFR